MSRCRRHGDTACRRAACAVLTALVAVLSSVPLCAQARQKPKPFSASDTVYMPRAQRRLARVPAGTPSQQDNLAPGAMRGVFSVYDDAQRCTPSAIAPATQTRLVPPAQSLVAKGFWLGNTAREYALEMTLSLGALLDHLRSNGDEIAARRHVCVGMADFSPQGPNARSYPAGYIMVDPRVLAFIQSQHPESLLRGSENMFLAHEFAHQVQFWNAPQPFFTDPSVRRLELAADCVAGALERSSAASAWKALGSPASAANGFQSYATRALADQAHFVGDDDVNSEHHHGRPAERLRAVLAGADIIESRLVAAGGSTGGVTGAWLLGQCNAAVLAMR